MRRPWTALVSPPADPTGGGHAVRQDLAFGGTRTNVDILNAKQQFFEATLDLTQARYNYLLSYLRLRKAAGTVDIRDLQDVARYFVSRE